MKKGLIIGGVIAAIGLFIGLLFFIGNISYDNKNVRMKNKIMAQQESNKANFDKMFKTIAQIAEVAETKMEKSKEAFKEIYIPIMEGRYDSDKEGALMKWVVESNPQFDLNAAGSLYDKLAVAIEANRKEFFIEQQKLITYNQEQHNLIQTWPGTMFCDEADTVAITIITSKNTKEVFATGEENDLELFNK